MGVLDELVSNQPPEALYHYTSLDGFLGILSTGVLWASKIQYLNDSTEYLFTIGLAEELLLERLEGEFNEKEKNKIKGMLRGIGGISQLNVCVCSFSEKRDVLSQWRAYGGRSGVSIGFNSSNLLAQADQQEFIVAQCIYDEEQQKILISQLIDETLSVDFNTSSGYMDPDRPNTYVVLSTDGGFHLSLAKLAPFIKNNAFHEEKEWRLISMGGISVHNMTFRSGSSMIIPSFDFRLGDDKKAYISDIIVGPTPHPDLSRSSILSLLAHYDAVRGVEVSSSEVPYRNW